MRQNVAHEVHFASLSACIREAFVVCQESLLWQVALLDTSYIGFLWRYPVAGTLRLLRAHRLISLHQSYSLHYISVSSETLQVMRDAKTRCHCTKLAREYWQGGYQSEAEDVESVVGYVCRVLEQMELGEAGELLGLC